MPSGEAGSQSPFEIIHPKPPAYEWLRFGEIKPAGWIRRQMQHDLEAGFLGHLDNLVPALIREDDIYGRDRLTRGVSRKELGLVAQEAAWQVQTLWWNSETQSNWWDGLIRTAVMLDDADTLTKVRAYVHRMLAAQDEDGYMGIYVPDLRSNFTGENGELWAQATLFRALIGYYEASGEARVLRAIERAVRLTMQAFPAGHARPFGVKGSSAGESHGLMLTDALVRLSQLTGREAYAQYAVWLYQQYSQSGASEDDVKYRHLVDRGIPFRGHGVHTYEHLRALLAAAYGSGNPALGGALEAYLAKLDRCLTPSGGPIGDEFIVGRMADPSETGYEYCSIHELLDSYTHLLQRSGAACWGDRAEWLLFNADQGARHPEVSAIAYLKTDNSYIMAGSLHPDDPPLPANPQTRYKYSPAHQDVAVCCVPNAGRIYPYYVKAMWMHSPAGLVATLYGPCQVRTTIKGAAVHIVEETGYPFNLDVTLDIEVERPLEFELAFRVPGWARDCTCVIPQERAAQKHETLFALRRTWHTGDRVSLHFEAGVEDHTWRTGVHFLSYGPLVFARPILSQIRKGRSYPLAAFHDLYCFPEIEAGAAVPLNWVRQTDFQVDAADLNPDRPWDLALSIKGTAIDPLTKREVPVRLVPLGCTSLRQVTFSEP